LLIVIAPPVLVSAATIDFTPSVKIPGMDKLFKSGSDGSFQIDSYSIANYIKVIFKFMIGIAGIVASAVFMLGGFMYVMAGGNPDKTNKGKSYVWASISGLILVSVSWLVLSIIDVRLVELGPIDVEEISSAPFVEEMVGTGCCSYKSNVTGRIKNICQENVQESWCNNLSLAKDNNGNAINTSISYTDQKSKCVNFQCEPILVESVAPIGCCQFTLVKPDDSNDNYFKCQQVSETDCNSMGLRMNREVRWNINQICEVVDETDPQESRCEFP